MPRTPVTAALVILALGAAGALQGQRTEHGAFVTRDSTGRDTSALEVYSRAGNRLQGRMVQHQKGFWDERIWRDSTGTCHTNVTLMDAGTISTWHRLTLRPDGSISHLEMALDSAFTRTWSAEFDHESVTLRSRGLGRDTTVRDAAPAPASLLYASVAVMEQMVRHARNQGRDSVVFSWYNPETRRVAPLSVISLGGDSVRMRNGEAAEWRVRVDARGRLLRLDGDGLGGPVVTERVPGPVDLDRFRAASMAHDSTWRRPRQSTPEEVRARCDAAPPPAGLGSSSPP
jgi:hypothetical protein